MRYLIPLIKFIAKQLLEFSMLEFQLPIDLANYRDTEKENVLSLLKTISLIFIQIPAFKKIPQYIHAKNYIPLVRHEILI